MRIASLNAHGVDTALIELWERLGHSELLPIQEQAINKGKVLEGQNVVVFSPTSSGKTFVGEMAAVQIARANRRVVYLVPQKALAEEKYQDFKRKYGGMGIRVVISTRDNKENDRDIRLGNFHVAVIVFEKMRSLVVSSPSLLSKMGLVVVDELQMIADKDRGASLELLLTKIKESDPRPQIIGLSAVLSGSERLAKWLGATLCRTEKRPVELRKGVLLNGEFRYAEHNSGKQGIEKFPPVDHPKTPPLIFHAQQLASRGESCLVFCRSKDECVQTARAISNGFHHKVAATAIQELSQLEQSGATEQLIRLLEHGIAYHNADLHREQRDIVERHFRAGEIRILCATTTLAMGINLPARNVFVDTERWERDFAGQWGLAPLTQAEYENISGRAGRLGLEQNFGRAFIVAKSQFEAESKFETYAKGQLKEFQPGLLRSGLSQHVLNLVASGLCGSFAEVQQVLLGSYTGQLCWSDGHRRERFDRDLKDGFGHCVFGKLLLEKGERLSATPLGRLAAIKGVSVDTAIAISEFLEMYREQAADITPMEILLALAETEDGNQIGISLSTPEYHQNPYTSMLWQLLSSCGATVQNRIHETHWLSAMTYEKTKSLKKALIMHDWINGVPTRQIETRFNCQAGAVQSMAGEFSWLAEMLCDATRLTGWPQAVAMKFKNLPQRILHGTHDAALQIASLGVVGLGRERTARLAKEGFDSVETLTAAKSKELEPLITRPVAQRLSQKLAAMLRLGRESAEGDEPLVDPQIAPEEPAWNENYPPSDIDGSEYRLPQIQVCLDGKCQDKRFGVRIGSQTIYVQLQSFELLLRAGCGNETVEYWVAGIFGRRRQRCT